MNEESDWPVLAVKLLFLRLRELSGSPELGCHSAFLVLQYFCESSIIKKMPMARRSYRQKPPFRVRMTNKSMTLLYLDILIWNRKLPKANQESCERGDKHVHLSPHYFKIFVIIFADAKFSSIPYSVLYL